MLRSITANCRFLILVELSFDKAQHQTWFAHSRFAKKYQFELAYFALWCTIWPLNCRPIRHLILRFSKCLCNPALLYTEGGWINQFLMMISYRYILMSERLGTNWCDDGGGGWLLSSHAHDSEFVVVPLGFLVSSSSQMEFNCGWAMLILLVN